MATRAQLLNICRQTGRALKTAPLHYLALQLPEASFDLVEHSLAPVSDKHPLFALLIILPLVWELSAISIAFTFASILRRRRGEKPSIRQSVTEVRGRLRQILPSSFLVAIVVLLGLFLLVPGIYFMAIYLFVPHFAMIMSPAPATAYLNLSTRLVRQHLWTTLCLVVFIFLLDFAIYLGSETLGTFAGGVSLSPVGRDIILTATKITLSLITSAAINVGVSYFFLEINSDSEAIR